jgi:hypothetical protein
MKPDWDKLMKEYTDSKSILIADVDCTTTGKDLCEEVGIEGFPTIKHGDPNNLEDYEGGRTFKDLQKFAKENLGPRCGPSNPDLCDADQKKLLESFMAMPMEELAAKIEEKTVEMKTSDTELEELLKGLQAQYEKGQADNKAKKEEIKAGGLGLMKSVQASKKAGGKAEL